MTEQQIIELIINEPSLQADELTAEQAAFLDKDWEELTAAEKRLYHEAWKKKPGTIEHAAAQIPPADLVKAVAVLRAIRDNMTDPAEFDSMETGASLLELLERWQLD